MNKDKFIDKILQGDCRKQLSQIEKNSIHLLLSDIPYGISLDEWDVLHNNTNSALLGKSPAQEGKSGFKRRGKPINGWSSSDKNIGKEYQDWVLTWSKSVYPLLKEGSSVFIFGARRTLHRVINAFEDSGFLLKDVLAWKKDSAHHIAQRLSGVYEKRGLKEDAEKWNGWRLGNLAPIYEPIAWFFKPYDYTIADNVLENEVGAMNIDNSKINGVSPTNLLEFSFGENEVRVHEAQKPVSLLKYLIGLTTREGQIVLDPFIGSGSTAVAAKLMNRKFIGFEIDEKYAKIANQRVENAVDLFSFKQRIEDQNFHISKVKNRTK